MAERRMFAKSIIDSDAFLDMPLSTQSLYFHLSMRADDDGFINNAKKIQRMLGCNDDDLKILLAKNFIIPFENGVCVIKHWRMHNYIRSDRYKETAYHDLKEKLSLKNNGVYTMDTAGIPMVDQMETQVRLGKDRIDTYTPENVSANLWKDFLKVRKVKRLAVTETAIKKIEREAAKANLTMEQVITICCEKGWGSFDASWDRGEKIEKKAWE